MKVGVRVSLTHFDDSFLIDLMGALLLLFQREAIAHVRQELPRLRTRTQVKE